MAECTGELLEDIIIDCENPTVGGVETNIRLFNNKDIDKVAVVINATNSHLIDNFQLKSGKVGFLLEGIKQINYLKSELVIKERTNNKYKHTFSFSVPTPSVENRETLAKMNGGRYAVMVETIWKGLDQKEPYLLGGYDVGMEISVNTHATNENDGTITVEMTSVDGYEEPKALMTVLDTDYNTTSTLFNNGFIQP